MTSETSDESTLEKTVVVRAPIEIAWRVFTEKMGTWWPLATHKIGAADAVDAVIEPRVGGRWYERGRDGSTCDWGRVLAWEPHTRLVLTWEISADWKHDPELHTEVEIRFTAETAERTRVDLVHRNLDAYGARRGEMRGIFDSEGGWTGLLAAFERAVSGAES